MPKKMINNHQQNWMRIAMGIFHFMLFFFFTANLEMCWAGDPMRQSLSTEELLSYTLRDLQKKIRDISAENQKISDKNKSLRKRVLVLQQEVRKSGDRKIELKDEENELKNNNQFGTREVSVWQMKHENAQLLYDQLKKRRVHLENFVTEQKRRQGQLEKQRSALQTSIDDLRQRAQDRKSRSIDNTHVARINNIKGDLNEVRLRVGDLRQQVAILEKRVGVVAGKHQRLLQDNNVLENKIEGIRSSLRQVVTEQQGLQEISQKFKNEININISEEKTAIGQWRLYRNNLRDAVDKQRAVKKQIVENYRRQEGQVLHWRDGLAKQNGLLIQERDVLQNTFHSINLVSEKTRQNIDMKQNKSRLSRDMQQLINQKETIRKNIDKAGQEKPVLVKKHRKLVRETDWLEAKLKKTNDKTQALQRRADKASKNELLRLSESEKRNIQRLQNDMSESTKKVEGFNNQITLARGQNEKFKIELKLIQEQLSKIEQEQKDTERSHEERAKEPAQAQQEIQGEITNLKLQRDIMSSSLTAIKTRYNQQELAIDEFKDEEGQLNDYLGILRNENKGLQEKVRVLMDSLKESRSE